MVLHHALLPAVPQQGGIVPGLIHGGSELATSWPFHSGCPPGELQQLARAALRV